MTAAIRKQIERSRYTHEGSKRVEVILDAATLAELDEIQQEDGLTRQQAITGLLRAAIGLGKIRSAIQREQIK